MTRIATDQLKLDERWGFLATDAGADLVEALGPSPRAGTLERAREAHHADTVHLGAELAHVRARASDKWPSDLARRVLSDRDGYEMASSWHAARHKASRFAEAGFGRVLDLCCGIGGDTLALLSRGLDVIAVDHDRDRAALCAYNAGLLGGSRGVVDVRVCDVLDESLPADLPFHLDPARRIGSTRTLRYEDLLPGPETIERLADARPAGAVKLNPGIDATRLPEGELEILSAQGRLTQSVLWTGALAPDGSQRRATRLDADGVATTLAGTPDRSDAASPLSDLLYAVDPAVERADLLPTLIDRTGLFHVHPGLGLLTGSEPGLSGEPTDPFLTPYRVLEEFSWSPKRARAAMRSVRDRGLRPGVVEVKTRARVVDPDKVQSSLRGDGDRTLTLFVLRFGDSGTRGILTERLST